MINHSARNKSVLMLATLFLARLQPVYRVVVCVVVKLCRTQPLHRQYLI